MATGRDAHFWDTTMNTIEQLSAIIKPIADKNPDATFDIKWFLAMWVVNDLSDYNSRELGEFIQNCAENQITYNSIAQSIMDIVNGVDENESQNDAVYDFFMDYVHNFYGVPRSKGG